MMKRFLFSRHKFAPPTLVAGTAALAFASSSRPQETQQNGSVRRVSAFYLRPDPDEISLLQVLQRDGRLNPNVTLRWGDELPAAADESNNDDKKMAVDVLITRLPQAEELDSLSRTLKHVIIPFAGPSEKTQKLMQPRRDKVSLHNLHFNAASTSELAVTLLLAAAKNVSHHDVTMRNEIKEGMPWKASWDSDDPPALTLNGKKAVVLGYGAIGTRVATVLQALGMEVHAVKRQVVDSSSSSSSSSSKIIISSSSSSSNSSCEGITSATATTAAPREVSREAVSLHGLSELDEQLRSAAVLMVCLPGTTATANLLGKREFSLLPKGSVVVNVGRGSVVDEDALFEALDQESGGHLGAAGIDVW
jgi:phosphoglycerate dehydrogenase-like enzyme